MSCVPWDQIMNRCSKKDLTCSGISFHITWDLSLEYIRCRRPSNVILETTGQLSRIRRGVWTRVQADLALTQCASPLGLVGGGRNGKLGRRNGSYPLPRAGGGKRPVSHSSSTSGGTRPEYQTQHKTDHSGSSSTTTYDYYHYTAQSQVLKHRTMYTVTFWNVGRCA